MKPNNKINEEIRSHKNANDCKEENNMTTIIKSVPNEKTSITLYYGVATQYVPGELADMVGTIMGEGIKPSSGYIELFAAERDCVANLTIYGELSETDAAIIPIDFSIEEIEGMEQHIEDYSPYFFPITKYKYRGMIEAKRIPKYLDDIKRYNIHHITKDFFSKIKEEKCAYLERLAHLRLQASDGRDD